jgi:hypothetical protein
MGALGSGVGSLAVPRVRRWMIVVLLTLIGVSASPLVALEGYSVWAQRRIAKPRLRGDARPMSTLVARTVWDELGESEQRVEPLRISTQIVGVLAHRRPEHPPGFRASTSVARILSLAKPRPSKRLRTRRKVDEIALNLWLTRHAAPDDLIRLWADNVYLGRGARGLEAGMEAYFDASLQEAEPEQLALLVALSRHPSRYDPARHPEALFVRRNRVLERMADLQLIRLDQLERATRTPLGVVE